MSVTKTIRPSSTADSSDFPPTTGTAHGVLSDDSDNSYVSRQAYVGETHICYGSGIGTIPTTGITSITSVKPRCKASAVGGGVNAITIIGGFRISSTNYDGFNQGMPANSNSGDPYVFDPKTGTTYTTNPSTAVAWTVSDVNSLGWWIGAFFQRDGNVANYSELYFDVILVLSPPTATTNIASNVTSTAAILNGTVNPSEASSTYPVAYYFQWGLTTAYGNTTSTTSGLTGSANVAAAKNISGLVANTTYHFRVVATNADSTVLGADQVLTTGAYDTVTMGF